MYFACIAGHVGCCAEAVKIEIRIKGGKTAGDLEAQIYNVTRCFANFPFTCSMNRQLSNATEK